MNKSLVLDTNILFRAVFGRRVPELLAKYQTEVGFFTPSVCYAELRKYAFTIGERKGLSAESIEQTINLLEKVVRPIGSDIYEHKEQDAKNRIAQRDVNDWPIVALALAIESAIWTEDHDFFGTGLSTWNSRNIQIFLDEA